MKFQSHDDPKGNFTLNRKFILSYKFYKALSLVCFLPHKYTEVHSSLVSLLRRQVYTLFSGGTVPNMSSLFLCSVSIMMLICTLTLAAQNFVNVTDCPKDANEWEIRSKIKNCYGDTPDYLCAPIENMLGRYGEICTIGRWIPESKYTFLYA